MNTQRLEIFSGGISRCTFHTADLFRDTPADGMGRLCVWSKLHDAVGEPFMAWFSEKPAGRPWESSPLVREGHIWRTPERIDSIAFWAIWCKLLDIHLDVRDRALHGRFTYRPRDR